MYAHVLMPELLGSEREETPKRFLFWKEEKIRDEIRDEFSIHRALLVVAPHYSFLANFGEEEEE